MLVDILIISLAVILCLVGMLGCIIPAIPGPPLSYAGLVLMYFWHNNTLPMGGGDEITGRFMLIWLAVVVVVTVLDYIVPVYFTKLTGGSKEAVRWSIAGTIIGMLFFPPFGIIFGAFIGALLGELIVHNKNLGASMLSALGSFMGFIFGTGLKLASCAVMLYYIIKFI